MIEQIATDDLPCFGKQEPPIAGLEQITFFYGPNGTGKSSLARAMAKCQDDNLDVALFNQEFIHRLVSDGEAIPGVFVIRDGAPEVQKRIEELSGGNGEIRQEETKHQGLETRIGNSEAALDTSLAELKAACWSKKSELPSSLHIAFDGYRNDRQKHLNRVLSTTTDDFDDKTTLEDLSEIATTLLEGDSAVLTALPETPEGILLSPQLTDIMLLPATSADETSFSAFVDRMGNLDWVSHGRSYLESSEMCCPFCQQPTDTSLAVSLEALFDTQYEHAIEQIHSLARADAESYSRFLSYKNTLTGLLASDEPELLSALSRLDKALRARGDQVQLKIDSPSTTTPLEDATVELWEFNGALTKLNKKIAEKNSLLANRKTELESLRERIWQYYVTHIVRADTATYEGKCEGPTRALTALRPKLQDSTTRLHALHAELKTLQRQLTSSEDTVETINGILKALGFNNFTIIKQPDQDTYALRRPSGDSAGPSLSEGERTLIAFLYYYHQVQQATKDVAAGRKLIAVIDDPVSSLDSETLFAINLLVRNILNFCTSEAGRLEQVFLLSHNAYFFKEAAFTPKGMKPGRRSYFVLRKGVSGSTVAVAYAENPIKSTYTLLWDDVRRAEKNPASQSASLQNSMRRIIENYFGIMGGIDNEKIYANIEPSEQWACKSLLSWINDGSHTAPWEIDYAAISFDANNFLSAFKKIFEATNQIEHHNMMMAGGS